jgi:hypothetical protein
MSLDAPSFARTAQRALERDGYAVHCNARGWRWVLTRAGNVLGDGPGHASAWDAWASALAHRLAQTEDDDLQASSGPDPVGTFYAATLPDTAFDAESLAKRHGLSLDQAHDEVERLRRQSVFMNDRFQVNVQLVGTPFGTEQGQVLWLSIKRRDRQPLHDWRILQMVKNQIVGAEHEGFEIYPAESRLVDTANQYHLFVFADPTVRLPVGFRERAVMDAKQAAACGAVQRDFGLTAKQVRGAAP